MEEEEGKTENNMDENTGGGKERMLDTIYNELVVWIQ